jgi:ArsR family transcriptional regulator
MDARLKALADPTRLRILNLLSAGELCVCDVVELLALPQPTISRHLGALRRAGLVSVTREWKFAHYRLAEASDALHTAMLQCVSAAESAVGALAAEHAAAVERARVRRGDPCE